MTKQFSVIALGLLLSTSVFANCSKQKPMLVTYSDKMATSIEVLDEALHSKKAPLETIKIIHHFEEGMSDFIEGLRGGQTCKFLLDEFQHFHEDIQLIYQDLKKQPALFYQDDVLKAWNKLLPTYVTFQNILYGIR